MVRILIFQIIFILFIKEMDAQNLLLNGSFEQITPAKGDIGEFYFNNFYAKNWFSSTDGSVDIYRSFAACDDQHVRSNENGLGFCVETADGDYCIGLCTITQEGYMEHITGTLEKPLEQGKVYKVSFALRFYGDQPIFSKGFGYKFSKDSVVFNSKIKMWRKLNPWYQNLYGTNKVYGDFQFDDFITDSTWTHYTKYYTAKGGERFLTFGQFAFQNDEKIINQLNHLRKMLLQKDRTKYIESGKILFVKQIDSITIYRNNNLSINYYLLDDVKVEEVTDLSTIQEQRTCSNGCVDSDPLTVNIPNHREITIDRGFEGDLSFSVNAQLNAMEKLVIELDKGNKIIVVNDKPQQNIDLIYQFKYPAKKLRGKTLNYYVEKITNNDIKQLNTTCTKEILNQNGVDYWVYKCKK